MTNTLDEYIEDNKLKSRKKKVLKTKDKFWIVIGCGNGLLSDVISNVVKNVNDLNDSELKDRVDRFYDKERAVAFAKKLALKTPGDSYYVLESISHAVIAPAQVKFTEF